jgi:hypothetical protein
MHRYTVLVIGLIGYTLGQVFVADQQLFVVSRFSALDNDEQRQNN